MNNIIVTKHAFTRLKERHNLNKKAAVRMADIVYENGIRAIETNGSVKTYLEYDADIREVDNGLIERICYGDYIYVFLISTDCVKLITSYILPKTIRKRIRYCNKKCI